MMNTQQRERDIALAVSLGLVANVFLDGLKTIVGIVAHSSALLADGINSTSDVAYYVVVSIFIKLARKPGDTRHPYGHHQMESIASVIVGSFVITTAVAIFWSAINKMYVLVVQGSGEPGPARWAFWIALFTVVLKVGLSRFTLHLGERTKSSAVLALARDHRNDVFSSLAASIGIFLGAMGYRWVDPLAGALVAVVVLRTGIEILRESASDLMDTVPGEALARQITQVLDTIPGVEQIEEIHAHRFGPYFVVNLTIGVEGSMSVTAGDEIACQVERALYQQVDFLRRVYVHYHPASNRITQPPAARLICEPYEKT